jgi:hypothetical protein
MNYKTGVLLLFILISSSCKSSMELYKSYKGPKISIGSGGGISGEYNEYILLNNGNLYHKNSYKKDTVFLGSISKNESEQIFENYFTLSFDDINLNSPGNFNYFIKFEEKEKNHKLLWTNSSKIDHKIKLFYDIFRLKVNNLTEK